MVRLEEEDLHDVVLGTVPLVGTLEMIRDDALIVRTQMQFGSHRLRLGRVLLLIGTQKQNTN